MDGYRAHRQVGTSRAISSFSHTQNTALMETSRLDGDNHASPYARLSPSAQPETLDDCVLRLVSNTMPY